VVQAPPPPRNEAEMGPPSATFVFLPSEPDRTFGIGTLSYDGKRYTFSAAGVTAARAKTLHAIDDPDLQILTGENWASASALGLAHDWPQRTIAATGNYGEIFARTTAMPRGLNALWLNGGLLAPLPLQ